MEAKYYTPQVEEFHVGFEFEVIIHSEKEEKEWVKTIYSHPTDSVFCKDNDGKIWTNESLRVKLLDREDIESCGWELDSVVKKEAFFIHKTSNIITGDIRLVYSENESSTEISSSMYGESFYGIIKNVSELKKLMVQLNIK